LNFEKSKQAYEMAVSSIPGGVNSPVRAFKAVGGHPIFIERGIGSHVVDVDGNDFIDYICSWGPLILGHANEEVSKKIVDTLRLGATFGMPTKIEITMAEKIKQLIPSIEKVRMVSSGTEATMSALRLARGYTGKNKIVKFEGCYHGHADYLLIKSGSGTMTFGQPSSPGIPQKIAEETLVATYNDIDSVKKIIDSSTDIAAIIVEPIAGNMGLIVPDISFLRELRKLTQENGILLIFDEVISGFRASIGGAQELFKIQPDLTCLGKIIGGGLPVGAFGGKSEIMDYLSPDGNVYQAGTLSGNPLAMAAGLETLKILERDMPYDLLNEKAATLASGIRNLADKYHLDVCVNQKGSLLTLFFAKGNISSYKDIQKVDTRLYAEFFNKMLNEGIHLPPSQFECWFISTAHTSEDIDKTLSAIDRVFSSLGRI
jgi:glutamate-1-semialdehyde-2,1-aminomutase